MADQELFRQIATIAEDKRQRPKVVRVLEAVLEIVDSGRDHLRAWQSVRDLVHQDSSMADLAMPFFALTALAHVEAAALRAAKVTDTHKDSVNIDYLLNIIQQDRHELVIQCDWPKLTGVIEAGRRRLAQIAPAIARIKDKRDRDLAHLDRRQVNTAIESQAIEVADLDEVFEAIEEIACGLMANSVVLDQVNRFSWSNAEELAGPKGIQDLYHFARAGFDDRSVRSPSQRVERIRALDRGLRSAKALLEGRPDGDNG